jgi:hypothetical protein
LIACSKAASRVATAAPTQAMVEVLTLFGVMRRPWKFMLMAWVEVLTLVEVLI